MVDLTEDKHSQDCTSCGEKMTGIRSHNARLICYECGGKPVAQCSKEQLALRIAQREGKSGE